jgi:hypothetical protein
MEEQYEGHCTGGPYDGQFLAWPRKRYVVAIAANPPLESYADNDAGLPQIGYSCYNFNLGHWIWQSDVAYPRGQARA